MEKFQIRHPPTKVRQTKKFRVLLILPPNLMPPTGRDTFLPNHFLGNPDHRTLSRVEWTTTSDHGGKYHSAEDSGGPSARRAVSRLVYDPPADAIQDERHSCTVEGIRARVRFSTKNVVRFGETHVNLVKITKIIHIPEHRSLSKPVTIL